MNAKLPLGIVIASSILLTACSKPPYRQPGMAWYNSDEPALVVKPFNYNGRTWFDTDKATLRPAAKRELKALSNELQKARSRGVISEKNKLVVIGHTDSRASHAYNQKLSERRAQSVAAYLASLGVPSAAMSIQGKGETQPVASNRTRRGMQKNRRVELHMHTSAIRVVYN